MNRENYTNYELRAVNYGVDLAQLANSAHTDMQITETASEELWALYTESHDEVVEQMYNGMIYAMHLATVAFRDYTSAAGELIGRDKLGDRVLSEKNVAEAVVATQ